MTAPSHPLEPGGSRSALLAIPVELALTSEPFYLESADPLAFASALALFAAAGAAAALWPAYRVLRRNPVDALKHS